MTESEVLPEVFGSPDLPGAWESAVLLLNKPQGITSFGVIKQIRRRVPVKKVGHAGTLDPMATGLLIVLVGNATRSMEAFMGLDKEYTGTIRLGERTASYDAETPVEDQVSVDHITDEAIARAAARLTGTIPQQPPVYSAIKMGGERLYRKARRGEDVDVPARPVRVDSFDTFPRQGRDVDFVVRCSKGTYIRSLAYDLGELLEVGGHLVKLARTAIGPYRSENAWQLSLLCTTLEKHGR